MIDIIQSGSELPVGAIANSSALALGGIAGAAIGGKLTEEKKSLLTGVMGLCALVIAVTNIVKLHNLTAVVLSLILGVIAGEAAGLDNLVQKFVGKMVVRGKTGGSNNKADWTAQFCVIITLFAASGTGVFGILKEGFEGDASILAAKAVLDFFTALIFAASLGKAVAAISIPQFCVYLVLFLLARVLYPYISRHQIMNFNAIGGLIDLAIGLTILNLKNFKTINFLPAFIFVFPMTMLFDYMGL
ncbi:MAG: DUF554 domain-containing protein [Clostridiales bacterium]|jgi:uncharacterized membrane protein YqgA involved in biofilm formation|nr:DUF554 domain-containing protein [Clostridiales bacterium]